MKKKKKVKLRKQLKQFKLKVVMIEIDMIIYLLLSWGVKQETKNIKS